MKNATLVILAVGLLAGPVTASAVPATGTYDITLSGATPGVGSFYFDASTQSVSSFYVSAGLLEGLLDFSMWDSSTSTCFVDWSLSPAGSYCSTYPSLKQFGAGGSALSMSYAFGRDNIWGLLDDRILDPESVYGYPRYSGVYSAALRTVPEPSALALLVVGLSGLVLARRRKLN